MQMHTDAPLARRVLDVLSHCGAAKRLQWESMLRYALQMHPPVFATEAFGNRYRELARCADWFADSLVANACLEGYGAQQILAFSRCLSHPQHAEMARQHALDESRHASVFIRMLDLVFPGLLESQTPLIQQQVHEMQPFLSDQNTIAATLPLENEYLPPALALAEIIQVHITEMRALVLQDLVREALLQHAPATNHARLLRISDHLISDEGRHIAYCADIIDAAAANRLDTSEALHEAFATHLRNFNELTLDEMERQAIEL